MLRRYVDDRDELATSVRSEAVILEGLAATDLPVPALLACDPTGDDAGVPSVLMSRLPGRVYLTPNDADDWLVQMARMLVKIHDAAVEAPAYRWWLRTERLAGPDWAGRPAAWERALEIVTGPRPPYTARFIHHDYQHFNLLWSRGQLTGVIDWVYAARGPVEADVGHCRLNLAVLFQPSWAERFLEVYEAEAGRTLDPYWDVAMICEYLPGWGRFLDDQIGGRAPFDRAGAHSRVEAMLEIALKRYGAA